MFWNCAVDLLQLNLNCLMMLLIFSKRCGSRFEVDGSETFAITRNVARSNSTTLSRADRRMASTNQPGMTMTMAMAMSTRKRRQQIRLMSIPVCHTALKHRRTTPERAQQSSKSCRTSSASMMLAKLSRWVLSVVTFGISEITIEDQALYSVSSQIEVAKQVTSSGMDRRCSSACRSENIYGSCRSKGAHDGEQK